MFPSSQTVVWILPKAQREKWTAEVAKVAEGKVGKNAVGVAVAVEAVGATTTTTLLLKRCCLSKTLKAPKVVVAAGVAERAAAAVTPFLLLHHRRHHLCKVV